MSESLSLGKDQRNYFVRDVLYRHTSAISQCSLNTAAKIKESKGILYQPTPQRKPTTPCSPNKTPTKKFKI